MSIRKLLLLTFLAGIIVLLMPFVYSVYSSGREKLIYQKTLSNMLLEYQLSTTLDSQLKTYTSLLSDAQNSALTASIQANFQTIDSLLSKIQSVDRNQESQQILNRIFNNSRLLHDYFAKGMTQAQAQDFSQSTELLDQITRSSATSKSDINQLVFSDLQYLDDQQQYIKRMESLGYVVGAVILIAAVVIYVGLSVIISNQIILPLISLSRLSELISRGELQHSVHTTLLARKDEIGILSRSLQTMLTNLKTTIAQLHVSQENMSLRNTDLEKFNKLTVDREMKMVELKEELTRLKKNT
jgi:HAMP domain-containing protein